MRYTKAAQDKAGSRKKIARLKTNMTRVWRIWRKTHTAKERAERAEEKAYGVYCRALDALNAAKGEGK